MDFYFEGLDMDGHLEAGIVHAATNVDAKDTVEQHHIQLLEIRQADPHEHHAGALDEFWSPNANTDAAFRRMEEEELVPLTGRDCKFHFGEELVTGQLSFLMTGTGERLVFTNAAKDVFGIRRRYWEVPIDHVKSVETHGVFETQLDIITITGETFTFSGNLAKADVLIRFAMFD